MRHVRHHRRCASLLIGAGLLLGLVAARAGAQSGDPVEDLRAALPFQAADLVAPTKQAMEYREQLLRSRINALRTAGQLRRALALEEWKEDPAARNTKLRDVDLEMRRLIGDRFRKGVTDVVERGSPNAKLATANLIAEIGPTIRSDVGDLRGFARSLTPQVKRLATDENQAVREQGLRALGNINADPKEAVPVFVATLKNDAVGPRRVAAEGLLQMVRVVTYLQGRRRATAGVESTPKELQDVSAAVVDASKHGLNDADGAVRRLLLEAVQDAARGLSETVQEGFARKDFPPEGRDLTDAERKDIVAKQKLVQSDLDELEPVLLAIQARGPDLAAALRSPSPAVRLAGIRALEEIGNTRIRVRRRVLSPPVLGPIEGDPRFKAMRASDPLATFLGDDLAAVTGLLREPDARARLAAVDVLELLEAAALPALPALTASLSDPDRFVRWAAARAISNVGPEQATDAVPGLAKLVCDLDNNVRLAALGTLQLMGPAARAAVPALAQAVTQGDSDIRVTTMATLLAVGGDDAAAGVPGLVASLTAADPRVRRAAAESLGRLGPLAEAAVPALRRALGDDDQDTRILASEALLSIVPMPRTPR